MISITPGREWGMDAFNKDIITPLRLRLHDHFVAVYLMYNAPLSTHIGEEFHDVEVLHSFSASRDCVDQTATTLDPPATATASEPPTDLIQPDSESTRLLTVAQSFGISPNSVWYGRSTIQFSEPSCKSSCKTGKIIVNWTTPSMNTPNSVDFR